MAGEMAAVGEDAAEFQVARVTVELLRAVPIGPVTLRVNVAVGGRRVQRIRASLEAGGKRCVEAQMVRIRRKSLANPVTHPVPSWPEPADLEPFEFPFFQHAVGYHTAVETKVAHGAWGKTPVGFWIRPRLPLVLGDALKPIERLMLAADAQSGMGVPLDPKVHTFINPDLCAYQERDAVGEWLGFDIRSGAGPDGVGLAQSAVRDVVGEFARTAQSLLVTER